MYIKGQRGLTLVEVIVFIVIVSVGLAGVLTSLNISVRHSADPLQPKQALAIAEALLEEVSLKAYIDPGAGTCVAAPPVRNCYDSLDDFSSFDQSNVTSLDGAITFNGYGASVRVAAEAAFNGVPMRKITVTVTSPSNSAITLIGYRANY